MLWDRARLRHHDQSDHAGEDGNGGEARGPAGKEEPSRMRCRGFVDTVQNALPKARRWRRLRKRGEEPVLQGIIRGKTQAFRTLLYMLLQPPFIARGQFGAPCQHLPRPTVTDHALPP